MNEDPRARRERDHVRNRLHRAHLVVDPLGRHECGRGPVRGQLTRQVVEAKARGRVNGHLDHGYVTTHCEPPGGV